MIRLIRLALALGAMGLAGCANALAASYAAYDTAVTAEDGYLQSGKASKAVVAKIEALRVPAYAALQASDQGAADAAIAALVAYETSQGIK